MRLPFLHADPTSTDELPDVDYIFTPVGGGVTIHPRQALTSSNLLADEDGSVSTPVIVFSVLIAAGTVSLSIWWYLLR